MFLKRTMWISLTAITLGLSTLTHAKACSGTVRELTDVGRRGPSYAIKSSSEPTISDSTLPTGWYVAKDGVRYYTMVNGTAPRYAYCGTDNPIYIKDRITKLEEGKEYQDIACLVNYDSNCTQRYNVKVRQCSQEIQYYLLPTDGTSAYCFEPSSVTVVAPAPNYRIEGHLNVSVALMYNRASKHSEPELEFKCNFGSARNQSFYGVNWVINGRIEKTFRPVKMKDLDSTNLNETTLRSLGFSFGISIQCAVRISSTPTGNQTSPQMSDTFYAGVKISIGTPKRISRMQKWAKKN
ncbi:uncharacterized protein LOC128551469 [Mercenaria mercenaria]|uniref:uncharacterized protein LOC128551469 n=1 Tax=Mercenaria mercenaria TaxID=6596 RepID=UPI00234ED086|nr:uncharacterized protein LOC128551469 [Mercenaria mercenaria]